MAQSTAQHLGTELALLRVNRTTSLSHGHSRSLPVNRLYFLVGAEGWAQSSLFFLHELPPSPRIALQLSRAMVPLVPNNPKSPNVPVAGGSQSFSFLRAGPECVFPNERFIAGKPLCQVASLPRALPSSCCPLLLFSLMVRVHRNFSGQ